MEEKFKKDKKDILYYLGFSHFLGIGPVRFKDLILHLKGVKKAYEASKKEIQEIIGLKLAEKFIDFRIRFDPVKKMEELKKQGISVLCVDDEDYPESLKYISDPPICIYIKGRNFILRRRETTTGESLLDSGRPPSSSTQSLAKMRNKMVFAIVGTRNPTSYGIQVARKFAYELTSAGFTIISGLAYGIDAVAHKACLDAGGKTIAVLGCGVNIVYPQSNRSLYERILDTGGAVISEFPPGQFVLKGLFVARNRIISALAQGVMIVEGGKDSGSLITAKYAAEQGKDVFAPPSPITSAMSVAPNTLLKEGAKLVTSIEDIFEEFEIKITPKKKENILEKLNMEEKEVFALLNKNPSLADNIALSLKKPIDKILKILSIMEIRGIVEKNSQNHYQIKLSR